MAGKSDFTEQEWEQLRKGATGAGLMVAASDRSFFDSFKEAGSLAKHLAEGRSHRSELVRELASEKGSGFGVRSSPEELESGTVEALRGAVGTLEAKAPEEVDAYRAFVLELAEAVSRSAGGGDASEAATVEKIRTALAYLPSSSCRRPRGRSRGTTSATSGSPSITCNGLLLTLSRGTPVEAAA